MYEAPRNTREKSDEWAKAELAASYATMNVSAHEFLKEFERGSVQIAF